MKKVLTLLTMLFVLAVAGSTGVLAQDKDSCIIVNGVKCYVTTNPDGTLDTNCDEGSSGSGAFTTTNGPIPQEGPISADLTPDAIVAAVVDPALGVIVTSLDNTQPIPLTTIRSTTDQRLPLDVQISFPAEAHVFSRPCDVYQSLGPLTFGNSDVNSFPFDNVTLTLQNDVQFVNRDRPDEIAFTLQAGSTTVTLRGRNLGDNGHDDPPDGGLH